MISNPDETAVLLALNKFAIRMSKRGMKGLALQQICQWKAITYGYYMWFSSAKNTVGIRKMEVAG